MTAGRIGWTNLTHTHRRVSLIQSEMSGQGRWETGAGGSTMDLFHYISSAVLSLLCCLRCARRSTSFTSTSQFHAILLNLRLKEQQHTPVTLTWSTATAQRWAAFSDGGAFMTAALLVLHYCGISAFVCVHLCVNWSVKLGERVEVRQCAFMCFRRVAL